MLPACNPFPPTVLQLLASADGAIASRRNMAILYPTVRLGYNEKMEGGEGDD